MTLLPPKDAAPFTTLLSRATPLVRFAGRCPGGSCLGRRRGRRSADRCSRAASGGFGDGSGRVRGDALDRGTMSLQGRSECVDVRAVRGDRRTAYPGRPRRLAGIDARSFVQQSVIRTSFVLGLVECTTRGLVRPRDRQRGGSIPGRASISSCGMESRLRGPGWKPSGSTHMMVAGALRREGSKRRRAVAASRECGLAVAFTMAV